MQITPAAHIHQNHYQAPYRPVTMIRDESESRRPEAGFQIVCGDRGCTEHYEISGPPSYPSQAIQKKFQQQGWFVHTSDYRKNRCPKHAHAARLAERTPQEQRAAHATDVLFGKKKTGPVEVETAAPIPDYTPKARTEHTPAPRAPRTELRQPKLAAKVLEVTGVPEDLNKFARLIAEQLKWAEKSVRDLKAIQMTLRDAMKHTGLQMGGQ